jgi:hypothetical protein
MRASCHLPQRSLPCHLLLGDRSRVLPPFSPGPARGTGGAVGFLAHAPRGQAGAGHAGATHHSSGVMLTMDAESSLVIWIRESPLANDNGSRGHNQVEHDQHGIQVLYRRWSSWNDKEAVGGRRSRHFGIAESLEQEWRWRWDAPPPPGKSCKTQLK